jgi:hypothetical protein
MGRFKEIRNVASATGDRTKTKMASVLQWLPKTWWEISVSAVSPDRVMKTRSEHLTLASLVH